VRSPLTGQANAVLLGPRLTLMASRRVVLNPGTWRERRVALVLSLSVNAEKLVAVDVHASVGQRQARSELDRVADLVGEPGACVVCGDFNVPGLGLPGFSAPLPGIDQVLVRGLELIRGPDVWPEEDRRIGDEVVSDHAPVEAVVTLPGSGG
jgi:endonuclease/exonuclease/phosphatase family metal-dependent hydrolase